MRKKQMLLNAVIVCATFTGLPAFADPRFPDPEANEAMLYRRGYATSLAKLADKAIPFFLLVDQNGTGHFVDYEEPGKPKKALMENGVPTDWPYRKPGEKPCCVWAILTQAKAKELWSEHHVAQASPGLPIFDAHGSFNGEENLYHLDLGFDKNGRLWRYRVRGIGLTNAKWISVSNGAEVASDQ